MQLLKMLNNQNKAKEMDNTSLWDLIKATISWAWIPFCLYIPFKNNRDNRDADWKDKIEQRVSEIESNDRLRNAQIMAIKDSLEEVKQGVNRLVERLIK